MARKFDPLKIVTEVMILTREIAEDFLSYNQGNRKLSEKLALHYAEKMQNEEWVDGVAEIAFDEKGRLINGQHVCTAVALMDKDYKIVVRVIRNMSPEAFLVYDTGKRRNGAQALELSGFNLGPLGYPFLRLVWLWKEYNGMEGLNLLRSRKTRVFSNERAVAMAVEMESDLPHYFEPDMLKELKATKGGAVAIFCRWLFDQLNEKKSERFFKKFLGFSGSDTNCPVRALKNALLNNERLLPHEKLHLFITSWNAFYGSETRRVIYRPRENTKLPVPEGIDA